MLLYFFLSWTTYVTSGILTLGRRLVIIRLLILIGLLLLIQMF